MATGCVQSCFKCVIFIINIFISLTGLGLMSCGIWALVDLQNFTFHIMEVSNHALENIPELKYTLYAILGIGAVLFTIGFFGCCGAACESRCMLTLYFVLVFLSLLAVVALTLMSIFMSTYVKKSISKALDESPADLNNVQANLNCSGSSNCADVIYSNMEREKWWLFGAAIIVGSIQLTSLICSCALCISLRSKNDVDAFD